MLDRLNVQMLGCRRQPGSGCQRQLKTTDLWCIVFEQNSQTIDPVAQDLTRVPSCHVLLRIQDFCSAGFNLEYSDEKSDDATHQVGKGHGDHVGAGVADKNGRAGGGLVNYFSDQAAEQ